MQKAELMTASALTARSPVEARTRITNLDAIRGVAVLGILVMNAVSYGLGTAPYFNLDAAGSDTWVDWLIGGAGEVFVDQKFMGLFSILFGAGIVLFADRAMEKGRHAGWFSLWRNALLLIIGLLHGLLWDGDVLVVYAVCAPILIALRKRSPRTLLILGLLTVMISPLAAIAANLTVPSGPEAFSEYWFPGGTISDEVGLFLYADFFSRALGMMLIGVAFYRLGIITGERPRGFYIRMAVAGIGIGLPLAALGLALTIANDFSYESALLSTIPNTLATIPAVLGYVAVVSLWNSRGETRLHGKIRAAGRMALTNYLSQTVIGVAILRGLFDPQDLTRTWIVVFVICVWALQLWWSEAWLARFRYGPAEWAWRSATYRRWQPLRL